VHKLKDNLNIFTELVSVFPPRELRDNYLVQVPVRLLLLQWLAVVPMCLLLFHLVAVCLLPRICCRSARNCSAASHPSPICAVLSPPVGNS
jgi:hypothetical protein